MNRYAEEANYFDTTVHPNNSQTEIMILLQDFGVSNILFAQGNAGGKFAWIVRFEYKEHTYRFIFSPLTCHYPLHERSYAKKRRTNQEQALFQMGRIAVHFVKAILTAAEAQPGALFGFMELPEFAGNGLPPVASEVDPRMISSLPVLQIPIRVAKE